MRRRHEVLWPEREQRIRDRPRAARTLVLAIVGTVVLVAVAARSKMAATDEDTID
jgi:hypothetical protein